MPGDFDETEFGSRRSVPAKSSKPSKPAKSSKSSKPSKPTKGAKASKSSKAAEPLVTRSDDKPEAAPGSSKKRGDSWSAGSWRGKAKKGRKRRKGAKPSTLRQSRVQKESPPSNRVESQSQETVTSGVLVPLDQWTRVLNQLGNLHEAGQQIAEARERAAKAETEAAFLRERLKELRAELEVQKRIPKDRG